MNAFRNHWYQAGLGLAILFSLALVLWHERLSDFRLILSISLITLFLHQFEEYQWPGYFPRMLNSTLFKSELPDRFPLNANTSWIINVVIGWLLYASAIVVGEHAVWLAIVAILVSCGNVIAHAILFNLKGRTLYNPGMATALALFLPLTITFFVFIARHHLVQPTSLITGLVLGALINYFGVLRLITLLADKNTPYVFTPFR